jgi:hypothetical protein
MVRDKDNWRRYGCFEAGMQWSYKPEKPCKYHKFKLKDHDQRTD